MTPQIRRLIDIAAHLWNLPVFTYRGLAYQSYLLLEALVLTESGGNPTARRYEPAQDRTGRRDAAADPDVPDHDDGDFEDDASWGLGQVMGFNARRILGVPPGTKLNYTFLYDPMTGLAFACRILRDELAAVYLVDPHATEAERVARALARYNGGPTGDALTGPGGTMRLQAYVDQIGANAILATRTRRELGWTVAAA